ncbi:MAG: hypothetical protein ACRCXT_12435 [Paraclostridium sp.]
MEKEQHIIQLTIYHNIIIDAPNNFDINSEGLVLYTNPKLNKLKQSCLTIWGDGIEFNIAHNLLEIHKFNLENKEY